MPQLLNMLLDHLIPERLSRHDIEKCVRKIAAVLATHDDQIQQSQRNLQCHCQESVDRAHPSEPPSLTL